MDRGIPEITIIMEDSERRCWFGFLSFNMAYMLGLSQDLPSPPEAGHLKDGDGTALHHDHPLRTLVDGSWSDLEIILTEFKRLRNVPIVRINMPRLGRHSPMAYCFDFPDTIAQTMQRAAGANPEDDASDNVVIREIGEFCEREMSRLEVGEKNPELYRGQIEIDNLGA